MLNKAILACFNVASRTHSPARSRRAGCPGTRLARETSKSRRGRLIFRFLLILFAGAAAAATGGAPTVLIFGDSLSAAHGMDIDQSWAALLQSRLSDQGYEHRVVNASISGETTEGGATRIASTLAKFKPELVVLELGGNDGLRGLPPALMEKNLRAIIAASEASGASVVLLGIRIPPNYGPRYTAAFEKVYRELALQCEIPWIEFFMEGIALHDELMQDDGIHPNAKAQPILLDNAWPIIQKALDGRESHSRPLTEESKDANEETAPPR